jgi:hypothetical protein
VVVVVRDAEDGELVALPSVEARGVRDCRQTPNTAAARSLAAAGDAEPRHWSVRSGPLYATYDIRIAKRVFFP